MSKELYFNEQEENATESIEPKKFDLNDALTQIKNAALQGDINPLEAYIRFNEIENLLASFKDEIKEITNTEAVKYKDQVFNGYSVNLSERKMMDYSHITEWNDTKKKLKDIEDKAKSTYNTTGGNDIVDTNTGEIIQSAKLKSVTNVLTLKKNK